MFLIDNNDNLTIPNFLQALGFIPPAGMDVDEIFVNDTDAPSVDKKLGNSGFEATQVNPQYRTVKYQRKDPKTTFSFSDNYVVPETRAAELVEFPKHIQANNSIPNGQPTPQYKVIKSPVKAVTILEGQNSYMVRIDEDNMVLPKGTVLKLTENEDAFDEGSLTRAVVIANLFANDLKMMHVHAIGNDFDKIHFITEQLYNELIDEIDELSEIAVSNRERVPNATELKSYVDTDSGEWDVFTDEVVTWPRFIDLLNDKGSIYLDALNDAKDASSVIEDYIHFWEKEVNYKNAARAIEDEPMEADYYDILDDADKEAEAEAEERENELSDDIVDMFTYNDAKANNSSWDGFETLTNDMVVAQGPQPVDNDVNEAETDNDKEEEKDDEEE